ncbi:molybdate transporter ATP-binding protein [compost metagenome]
MRTRRRLRAELRRIQEATATPMILVTHDLTEVRQLSDSLVVIEYGQVLAAGPTEAVLAEAEAIFSELTEESIE